MDRRNSRSFVFSRTGLALLGFLAIAGYFLWTEHRAHLVGALSWLPWLLLLACPLLHLFHHGRGHSHEGGAHDSHAGHDVDKREKRAGGGPS